MPTSPIVSILITLYNREQYVAETIKSALQSRFNDYEIIVVDDRSTDTSVHIVQSLLATDKRIRLIENEVNLGDYGNRLKAASLASGKYIKYLDSDDLLYPHSLDVMVDALERFPDCVLGLSHSATEDDEPYPWRLKPAESFRKHFLGRGCFGCGPSGAIIRRDEFLKSGGFDKTWGVLADTELWLRLASSNPIVLLPPSLVWWRRHEGQEYTKGDAQETYMRLGHKLALKALDSSTCPLDSELRKFAEKRSNQHFARKILSLAVRERKPFAAFKLYSDSKISLSELLSGFRAYS